MTLSNMTRIESLLTDPASDITLPELKTELNELAKLRQGVRLAFCKRLAVAYLLMIGHRPIQGSRNGETRRFINWCRTNLITANGKRYSSGTIATYLGVGFASNPEKLLQDQARSRTRRDERMRRLGGGLARAIESGAKVVPIQRQRDVAKLDTDVAQEVNVLMTAWERCSPVARAQFIYMVTGIRVAS